MSGNKIYVKEKKNPPRIKEEYSTLSIKISSNNPNVIISEQAKKGVSLKMPMPLIKKIEGPFDKDDNLVKELIVGEKYTYKATKFKDSIFSPIKHIWWAEQLNDGEIVDLEYDKGKNPYLDENGAVCYDYEVKDSEKTRIYAYIDKPTKEISIDIADKLTKGISIDRANNIIKGVGIGALVNKITNETSFEKTSTTSTKSIVAFFIGGAGDKEDYYGQKKTEVIGKVEEKFSEDYIADDPLSKYYKGYYLNYNEVKGAGEIHKNVLSKITDKKNTAIYIIGHSLGGWNGAQLSGILSDIGYNVELLVTIDPVGEKIGVTIISNLYWNKPNPKAKDWMNIRTKPKVRHSSDWIAFMGGQWELESQDGLTINEVCGYHHVEAKEMFFNKINSMSDSLCDRVLASMRSL